MDNALKWYAVYTRSRFEKKAAERLTEQGIEAIRQVMMVTLSPQVLEVLR